MVSSGESARAHCGQTHGCCSTLTLDSKPVASGRDVGKHAKSLANARSPCRGGNRLLWKNDTAANSTEHPGAEAGFWGGTGTTAGESSRRPRRAPAQRRTSTSARLEPFHLGRYVDEQAFRFNERSRRHGARESTERASASSGSRLAAGAL